MIASALLLAAAASACSSTDAGAPSASVDFGSRSATLPSSSASPEQFVGRWRTSRPDGHSFVELVLQASQDISGFDGCNAVSGRWSFDRASNTAVIANLDVSSYKACPGVDLADLSAAVSASVVGQRLNIFDAAGSLIARL